MGRARDGITMNCGERVRIRRTRAADSPDLAATLGAWSVPSRRRSRRRFGDGKDAGIDMTRFFTRAAALGCALALAGCYEFSTAVSAIPETARLAQSPVAPGLYCGVTVDLNEEGRVKEVDVDSCAEIGALDGRALVPSDDEDDPPAPFDAADLGRGLYLMQGPDEGEERLLAAVRVTENGFALLPEPKLTKAGRDAAAALGVVLEGVDVSEPGPGGATVIDGSPDAVLDALRSAMGLWLDAALREEDEFARVLDDALYYVRLDADPEEQTPDMAAVRAEVERLRALVAVSMTLE